MSDTSTTTPTVRSRLVSSVLVILVPVLLGAVLGLLTGSMGLGVADLALLVVIWVVGLVWVWRPRKSS